MAPELLQDGEVENVMTKASDVYSYGCVMMQVRCVLSFKSHIADMMQVFSGYQPYANITSILAVMGALQKGRKPFSQLTGINEEIQQFAQLCWSRNREDRPLIATIVVSLTAWANIAETLKTLLSQLPQISQAALTKCDYHPDGLDVLGATLKYKWVVHGSNETEVSVFVWIYGIVLMHQSSGLGQDVEG
jgi:serine/threonine protein kinase